MTEEKIDIPVGQGRTIAATCHYAVPGFHKAILICPAMGVTAKFYNSLAVYLCEQGFDVLTFDYQGMGLSKSASDLEGEPTMQTWAESDLDASLRWIQENLRAKFLAILGHSAGGQLAGISGTQVTVDAIVLVASQSGYWRHWAGIQRLSMILLWYLLIPVLTAVFGRFPARKLKLGEDLPRKVAQQWASWGRSKNYIASDPSLAKRLAQYEGPILAYSFTDDAYAPKDSVTALLACYSNAKIEHIVVNAARSSTGKIGHFGFFREYIAKDVMWKNCVNWLEKIEKKSRKPLRTDISNARVRSG